MKPSDPLLLADVTLRSGMYPAGKVAIFRHLATPRFPKCDHTVSKLNANSEVKYSRPPDLKSSSNVSLPFAWITGPATDPSFNLFTLMFLKFPSFFDMYLLNRSQNDWEISSNF